MQLIQAECIEVNALLKSGRKGEDYDATGMYLTCVHKLPTSKEEGKDRVGGGMKTLLGS